MGHPVKLAKKQEVGFSIDHQASVRKPDQNHLTFNLDQFGGITHECINSISRDHHHGFGNYGGEQGGHPEEEAVEDGVEVGEDDRPSSQLQNLTPDVIFTFDVDDD